MIIGNRLAGLLSTRNVVVFSVILGGSAAVAWYLFSRNSKPKSIVSTLAHSQTKTLEDMVAQLVKLNIITNKKVEAAMLTIDRANYVPSDCAHPYREIAVPIGFNATISAPHAHALGLDLLAHKLVSGACVLDIGCGSGYVSACLASMVHPAGRVFGVDHVAELVEQGKTNIVRDSPILFGVISLEVGDGFDGLAEHAPYDAIYVGAASSYIPQALVDQLSNTGRMVIPVGPPDGFHSLVVVDKDKDGVVSIKNMGVVRFIPLTTYEKQVAGGEIGVTKVVQSGEDSFLVRTQYYAAPDSTSTEIKILKKALRHTKEVELADH